MNNRKISNRPDDLENECYADFATGYVNVSTKDVVEDDDIEYYTAPVSNLDEEELSDALLSSIFCNEVSQT